MKESKQPGLVDELKKWLEMGGDDEAPERVEMSDEEMALRAELDREQDPEKRKAILAKLDALRDRAPMS